MRIVAGHFGPFVGTESMRSTHSSTPFRIVRPAVLDLGEIFVGYLGSVLFLAPFTTSSVTLGNGLFTFT